MRKNFLFGLGMIIVLATAGCQQNSNQAGKTNQIANPASTNCTQKGGELTIEKKPDGSEYGVCTFKDSKQCEEWAMFGGACPEGGVETTGYDQAARYCIITGNKYPADQQPPQCSLSSGKVCDVTEYYQNNCLNDDNNEFWKEMPAQVEDEQR